MIFGCLISEKGTISVKSFVFSPAEFDALTVNVNTPSSAGMPEIVPEESSVSPSGSVPSEIVHVMGAEPIASRVVEYCASVEAVGMSVVVMRGAVADVSVSSVSSESNGSSMS